MKTEIHPKYFTEAKASCSCGNTWTVGSTAPVVRTDVCNACHPFYTGEQRIVDTEGQVDRFYQRLERRASIQAEVDAAQAAMDAVLVPIAELQLPKRAEQILTETGHSTAADLLESLEKGDDELLKLQGFGRKSLIDLKKALRSAGYDIG
ncbi:MAG: 50S ribosomal protein L31 [Chloroflexota bacterium]